MKGLAIALALPVWAVPVCRGRGVPLRRARLAELQGHNRRHDLQAILRGACRGMREMPLTPTGKLVGT